MRYEEVLHFVDGCGVYRVIFIIFEILSGMRFNTSINSIVFAATSPILRCAVENGTSLNSTGLQKSGWCKTARPVPGCVLWEYSSPQNESIVQEWHLCNDHLKVLLIQTTSIFGFGIGGYVAATLSDKYGRIRVYFISAILDCVVIIAKSFSVNYWMYLTLNMLTQAISCTLVVTFYTYMNEISHPKKRRFFEFIVFVSFSLGQGVLSLQAFLTQSWRNLERVQLVFSLTNALLIAFVLRESPKWLLVVNKTKAAHQSLSRMTALNGRPRLTNTLLDDIQIAKETKKAKLVDLTSSRQLLVNTSAITLVTTMIIMVYFIITWNSPSFLSGNIYLNNFIMGITEIPNCLLILLLVRCISKKWLLMSSLILCAATLTVGALFKQFLPALPLLSTVFIFVARTGANFAWNVQASFMPEIFPTSLRSNGMGVTNFGSRLLSSPMPFLLAASDNDNVLLPSLVMAGAVILSTLSLIFLPNTIGCRLPDTIDETRQFKRGSEHLFYIDVNLANVTGGEEEEKAAWCNPDDDPA